MSVSDNKVRAATAIIGLIILLMTEGCIIIPTPWIQSKYTQKDLSGFRTELFTKEDVLNKFGQPDIIWETERVYVYRWERLWGIVFIGGAAAGQVQGASSEIYLDEALLVLFDQDDCIERMEKVTRSVWDSYDEFLIKWRNQQKE